MIAMSLPNLPPRWFSMLADLASWPSSRCGVRGPDKVDGRGFSFKRRDGREGLAEHVWRALEHRDAIPVAELAESTGLPPFRVRGRLYYPLRADVLREVNGRIVRGSVYPGVLS